MPRIDDAVQHIFFNNEMPNDLRDNHIPLLAEVNNARVCAYELYLMIDSHLPSVRSSDFNNTSLLDRKNLACARADRKESKQTCSGAQIKDYITWLHNACDSL